MGGAMMTPVARLVLVRTTANGASWLPPWRG
jgi:hypothetical protein